MGSRISDVVDVIKEYAEAYSKFECLQKKEDSLLPKHGDQKTGIIGEFYIYQYLQGKADLKYANHGSSWDIEYTDDEERKIKIQVKTVLTGFSKTNMISPIKKGWDYLYLLSLGKSFVPNGFWIIKYNDDLFENRDKIQSARIKDPINEQSKGSEIFDFSDNKVDELLEKLNLNKR